MNKTPNIEIISLISFNGQFVATAIVNGELMTSVLGDKS